MTTASNLDRLGFDTVKSLLSEKQITALVTAVEAQNFQSRSGNLRLADKVIPEIGALANSDLLIDHASRHLPSLPKLIRAIYFDKYGKKNWLVSWHQDKTIALSEMHPVNGWGPWSIKNDTHHVQPPVDVLNNMLTIRIHLDDTNQDNGCLKVIPATHKLGIINDSDIRRHTSNKAPIYCTARAGDAIFMRPLILHASEKSKITNHRRVLHFEYSSYQLPQRLSWSN